MDTGRFQGDEILWLALNATKIHIGVPVLGANVSTTKLKEAIDLTGHWPLSALVSASLLAAERKLEWTQSRFRCDHVQLGEIDEKQCYFLSQPLPCSSR